MRIRLSLFDAEEIGPSYADVDDHSVVASSFCYKPFNRTLVLKRFSFTIFNAVLFGAAAYESYMDTLYVYNRVHYVDGPLFTPKPPTQVVACPRCGSKSFRDWNTLPKFIRGPFYTCLCCNYTAPKTDFIKKLI